MTREYPLERIRNIGIIAHIDAGKTTTTERILFYSGKTHRIGSVDDGTTVTDWMEQERERGITIVSAAITTIWNNYQINLIDTPGHIDFTAEVQRSLSVLDGGVVLFDGVQGVEPQSETVWRQANKFNVPRICFINKLDRVGASYDYSLKTIREKLGANPIQMQIPIGEEENFTGVVDLLDMKAVYWRDELGSDPKVEDIPPDLIDIATEKRAQLVETIAEFDDSLIVKFLDNQEITIQELKKALREAVIKNIATPAFCGSSLRNKGVQLLLDAIVDYLPSPLDIPSVNGIDPKTEKEIIRRTSEEEPLAALVFKIVSDPYAGRMAYIRIYSGKISKGMMAYNVSTGKKERVGRLIRVFADHREDVEEIGAGDIGAVLGMKNASTGDTICSAHNQILLGRITFPDPVISVAIEPKTSADRDKLDKALQRLSEEDPTFKVRVDKDTGQTLISGMGELHLEILVDRMLREFNVQANVGKPRISYRETISKEVPKVEYKYAKQTGGRGQYGHVVFSIEPLERGGGVQFENKIVRGSVPSEYFRSVEMGVRDAAESGVIAGYPVTDVKVTFYDGSFHEVDSSEMAFKMAAIFAFREGIEKAQPIILEPIMHVEVLLPSEYLGDVLAQLSSRRGEIRSMEDKPGKAKAVNADIPLGEMFGYATELRSATQGRGIFTMEFSHYAPVSEEIRKKYFK
ncbi:MAG: elongation factor G [Anaerolineaceae bacterium]|nr:elongation factor G [Anaerolineaceae bacterium]